MIVTIGSRIHVRVVRPDGAFFWLPARITATSRDHLICDLDHGVPGMQVQMKGMMKAKADFEREWRLPQ